MARLNTPTSGFWNCVGISGVIISFGTSWTLIRGNAVEMQLAQYKLRTGAALSKVQKANQIIEDSVESLPVASPKFEEAKKDLLKSNELLEEAQTQIDSSEQLLIKPEIKS